LPAAAGRGTAIGKLVVLDSQAPSLNVGNLQVGLAAAPYLPEGADRPVDWQRDSKHYQFWARGDGKGRFTVPNVRPGSYTLYALADGKHFLTIGAIRLAGDAVIAVEHKGGVPGAAVRRTDRERAVVGRKQQRGGQPRPASYTPLTLPTISPV